MVPHEFQVAINTSLKRFFSQKQQKLSSYDQRLGQLVAQIADVTLRGGDRMRPYFCWLGFRASGGTRFKQVLYACLALEMIQSYAIIHDDIMDQAEKRRGGLTIHAYFTQNYRRKRLADSLAILAGNLCNLWAHELFRKNRPSKQATDLFLTLQEEVLAGQTLDIWGLKFAKPADVLHMYQLKSASYTVEKPLLIGTVLGHPHLDQGSAFYQALANYGQKLGLAFQLRDDELGVFGAQQITGKSANNDLIDTKWTYLVALTYAKLESADKSKFEQLFAKDRLTVADADWVKSLMLKSGVREKQQQLMQRLVRQGKKDIKELDERVRKDLVEIAEFAIAREF